MTIYYVMYLLIILFSIFIRQNKNTNRITGAADNLKRVETFVMIGLICLVVALRHPSMGCDLMFYKGGGYLENFQIIGSHSWGKIINSGGYVNYEWGYIIFNKIISYISMDYQCLIIMCAIASLIPLITMIVKYSYDRLFAVIVYLGLPSFLILYSGLRQGIAIGIVCFSYKYIEEKKLFKFVLTVLLASFFHSSAIIFLIVYPVFFVRLNRKTRIFSLIGIAVVYVFRIPLFRILSKLFKDDATLEINSSKTLLLVFVAIYIFCTVFIDENDKITNGFLNIFYLAIICMCFSGVYLTAMRVGYYFMIALIIALPNVVSCVQDKTSYLISKLSISIIFIIYGLYAIFNSTWADAYPYNFFWQ